MLVATWEQVPAYGGSTSIVRNKCSFYSALPITFIALQTNTFQGMLVTNYSTSFAVFTYYCGDLGFSNGATIGFSSGDGLFANHPAVLRGSAQSIACLKQSTSLWVNAVYEVTIPGEDTLTNTTNRSYISRKHKSSRVIIRLLISLLHECMSA